MFQCISNDFTSDAAALANRPNASMVARTDTVGGAARWCAWQRGHHILAGRICLALRIVWRVVSSRSRRRIKASTDIEGYPSFLNVSIISGNQTFWASPEAISLLCGSSASWTTHATTLTACARHASGSPHRGDGCTQHLLRPLTGTGKHDGLSLCGQCRKERQRHRPSCTRARLMYFCCVQPYHRRAHADVVAPVANFGRQPQRFPAYRQSPPLSSQGR